MINALTINTLDGRTYYDAQIEERDAAGIHITHSAGACYLLYTNLPKSIRDANNYDPNAAAEFLSQKDLEKKQEAAQARKLALKRQKEGQAQAVAANQASTFGKEQVPSRCQLALNLNNRQECVTTHLLIILQEVIALDGSMSKRITEKTAHTFERTRDENNSHALPLGQKRAGIRSTIWIALKNPCRKSRPIDWFPFSFGGHFPLSPRLRVGRCFWSGQPD